jgi:hypothetical protein
MHILHQYNNAHLAWLAYPHEINMSNDLIYSICCPYVPMLLSCMNRLLLMLMQPAIIFVTIQGLLRKLPFIIWKVRSNRKLTKILISLSLLPFSTVVTGFYFTVVTGLIWLIDTVTMHHSSDGQLWRQWYVKSVATSESWRQLRPSLFVTYWLKA